MADPTDSFKKFNYGLRPSKQVERKILMELLLRLTPGGFNIPTYTYVGFGSVYYIDFVLFHKYLYMKDMVCVEWSDIPKRMAFNKPYRFISLQMQPLASVIQQILTPRKKYVLWLDYDRQLDADMLADVDNSVLKLPRKSVFLITVEARARVPKDIVERQNMNVKQQERWLVAQFRHEFGHLLNRKITVNDLDPAALPHLYWEAITAQIRESMVTRDGIAFHQLFHFIYADGADMLTVGGVIGTDEDYQELKEKECLEHPFISQGEDPIDIKVPPLTFREKQWLDSNLKPKLKLGQLAFELDEEFFENYKRYYKEYPIYMESLT